MGDKVKVQELDPASQEMITSLFRGMPQGFARFGEGGYIMPANFKDQADDLKNMAVRPEDVWVITYPRSGTTWTQELVWLLNNDLDFETALKIPLMARYLFIEFLTLLSKETIKNMIESELLKQIALKLLTSEDVLNAPSPRFIKTHLPFSLLPDNLLDTTKVVYVARNPRDVAVSFYHHNRVLKNIDYVGDFKTFWKLFMDDLALWTPFFLHLKEAWAHRSHPNMLFLFYEDLKKDLPGSINCIAKFFGKKITSEQTRKLCEHLDIRNFKNNESVNPRLIEDSGNSDAEGLVRRGEVGSWRDFMDAEMQEQAAKWIENNLADTDLRFPGL